MSGAPRIVSVMTTDADGGAEYANVDLLDALAARGWSTTLLTNRPHLVDGTRVEARPIDLGPKLGRRTLPRVGLTFPRSVGRLRAALEEEARRAPIDVTLLHFKKEQLMTRFLPREHTGRLVWAEWGPLPEPMRRAPMRSAYCAAARRADAIVAVSQGSADTLVAAGVPAGLVDVLPPVIASDPHFDAEARARVRASWGADDRTFVIGCVSRLASSKRVDVLLRAVGRLDDDVKLVLAGTGEDEARLRELAAPLGARVHFAGSARGRVSEMLSGFDVQVFAPQRHEGLPRSVMLGMLMGLCVLATAPEGTAELLTAATIATPAHDPRAVAALLDLHRRDPELTRAAGLQLRAIAEERFDPARVTARAERLLLGYDRLGATPTAGSPR